MAQLSVPTVDYTEYSNRQLVAIPLALLAVALLVIGGWYLATGAPANLGLEFVGGSELRIDDPGGNAEQQIEAAFSAEPESIRQIAADDTYIVSFSQGVVDTADGETQLTVLEEQAEAAGFSIQSSSSVSASFGSNTQTIALGGVIVAFLGMSLLVFAMFRSVVPSIAVIASAFSDVMLPLAMMNLLGINLSLGTVAALLMLIGYSVDSDILLNNSVLRESGDFYESTSRAMRTGVTMTLTSIAAMAVMTVSAFAFGIQIMTAIGIILVIGLLADLMNTYLLNVSLLRWHVNRGVKR
ncbi:protein translocase subunit SecF [Halonotius terrestris]|uniref:Protein-export membrane protein SecF n=1 Tax=Halonotius terrestris TaxID=2487750 RepID=A0A8J8P9T3_9EURY|nr:protein translocase subunit SecF [Halonotius terrestris]TQQ81255.1 protein translocase subunit SecF [Halonotius terrestris]